MKLGIIGDAHFRQDLAYADYIEDRREGERKQILHFIVESFKDCDGVVFMGDNFDKPNPPSQVVKAFTEFVERFNGKQVYILAGNHEKTASGKSAIDYLREIKNPNWKIITNSFVAHGELGFVPYFFRQELQVETFEEGKGWILEKLRIAKNTGVKYIFVHHAISDTLTVTGQNTSLFPEIVLPKAELEGMFNLVIGGHIHKPQQSGKTVVTGCVFNNEIGDNNKKIWILETDTSEITSIVLPGRPLIKLENPSLQDLERRASLTTSCVIKVVLTERGQNIEMLKEGLRKFDAFILLEQYPNERKKLHVEEGAMMEFTVENLLGLYAKEKSVDEQKLLSAWELIK